MDNAKLLKHVLSRIMKNEYSFIKDVNVTEDINMQSYYTDKERNVVYNIWFELYDWEPFDDWKKFEEQAISVKNGLGLKGGTRFYYLEGRSDGDSDFY